MRSKLGPHAVLILFLLFPNDAHSQQNVSSTAEFGGDYSSLRPQQKRLVDDWFTRFGTVVKKTIDPAEAYDKAPLSMKTTLNAVTHALLTAKLTDRSGNVLAESAIELVDKVDTIAGEIVGRRGDEQFRIYVQTKPGALELLNQSKEFARGPDNTVFHKGYPMSYRSTGGTPSIQFSLTRDASRADIDVDYRSSKFPSFLVNGHLTASNSDVRAGNNDVRHNNQWAGLQNWWRNILGLPFAEQHATSGTAKVIANEPKLRNAKPADAIFDFLNSWLVEQKPDESVAYLTDETFACMEVERGTPIDRGMARFIILQEMIAVNRRLGKSPLLSDAVIAVDIQSERIKAISQAHQSQFALYDVREDLAEQFKCASKLDSSLASAKALKSRSFGKYVTAIFRIKGKGSGGHTVATLWHKDSNYWKMISYRIDPALDRNQMPDVGAKLPATAPLEYFDGDKGMLRASSDFLTQWLVKKDIDKALTYIDTECLGCVSLYMDDEVKPPANAEESRTLLAQGLTKTADSVGGIDELESVLVPAQPHHHDLKLVKHKDSDAFVVVAAPEYLGLAMSCERRNKANGEFDYTSASAMGYGKYYAVGFSMGKDRKNPAVFWLVWRKVNQDWKAVSYLLMTP